MGGDKTIAINFIKINGISRTDKKEGEPPLKEGPAKQGYVEFTDNNRAACYPYYSPENEQNQWEYSKPGICSKTCKVGVKDRNLVDHIYLKSIAAEGQKENLFMTKFEERTIEGKLYEVFEQLKSE